MNEELIVKLMFAALLCFMLASMFICVANTKTDPVSAPTRANEKTPAQAQESSQRVELFVQLVQALAQLAHVVYQLFKSR